MPYITHDMTSPSEIKCPGQSNNTSTFRSSTLEKPFINASTDKCLKHLTAIMSQVFGEQTFSVVHISWCCNAVLQHISCCCYIYIKLYILNYRTYPGAVILNYITYPGALMQYYITYPGTVMVY